MYVCVCVCVCECMSYGEKRDGVWRREMRRGHEGIKQERSQFHPQILEGMRVKGWIRMRSIGKRDSSWTKLFVLCVRVRGLCMHARECLASCMCMSVLHVCEHTVCVQACWFLCVCCTGVCLRMCVSMLCVCVRALRVCVLCVCVCVCFACVCVCFACVY